jgi:hypothetical protein
MADQIPIATIGTLSSILDAHWTHKEINSNFESAGAPELTTGSNKAERVRDWLRKTNKELDEPLVVLGRIIEMFVTMDRQSGAWSYQSGDWKSAHIEAIRKINDVFNRDGLSYQSGGYILKGGSLPTVSLEDNVKKHGLKSVEVEIRRALATVESDPHAAVQFAVNALEATLKTYLEKKKIEYSKSEGLSDLWRRSSHEMGIKAGSSDNLDIKKIVSGMHSVVDGIAHIRNNKSSAHGRSDEQARNINIKPRHARLAINSAHTVAAYVLEVMD